MRYPAICGTCWQDGRRITEFQLLSGLVYGCPIHGIREAHKVTERQFAALRKREAKLAGIGYQHHTPCPGCFSGVVNQAKAGSVYCSKCCARGARP